ncbi:MAG: SCO family protein, partial [Blastocatellia bacterium]|nr:SCO family protein [Blastocatellia bacterium]
MNRRNLFTSFAKDDKTQSATSYGATRFTNAVLRTQENKEVRFYDDLIKGKQVVINLMYATCEGACPLNTANLIKVHKALKHRMGKDLFFY